MEETTFYLQMESSGEKYELSGEMVLGRSADCQLVISEGEVSRRHAKVTASGGAITVEDMGSSNGTFVNDTRIDAPTALNNGDRLRLDKVSFVVTNNTAAPAPAADAPSDKTMVRSPEELMAELEDQTKKPGGWVDPKNVLEGTAVMTPEQLQAALAEAESSSAPAAGTASSPQITITSGAQQGLTIPLGGSQSKWSVGSAADCDVRIEGSLVSALHAEIANEGGRWKLTDNMSQNGTFVNDAKALSGYLNSGDRVRFGDVSTVVDGLTAGGGGAAAAKPAPAAAASGGGGGGSNTTMIIIGVVAVAVIAVGAFFLLS